MPGGKKNLDGVMPKKGAAPAGGQPPAAAVSKDTVLVSWESLSFERKDKNAKWYAVAGILLALAIGFLIWQKDWFTIGILVIVTGVLVWYTKTTKPQKVSYKITPLGIYAGDHLYPFSEIHSFWLVYNEGVKNLYVAFIRKYLPALVINVADVDPIRLKAVLQARIPEQEKRGESLIDKFVRILGL